VVGRKGTNKKRAREPLTRRSLHIEEGFKTEERVFVQLYSVKEEGK